MGDLSNTHFLYKLMKTLSIPHITIIIVVSQLSSQEVCDGKLATSQLKSTSYKTSYAVSMLYWLTN